MACTLPTLDKTWEFDVNNLVNYQGSHYATHRAIMFALKTALINTSDFTSPWVVESGCDSSTVVNNNPATADVWLDTGDLIWNSTGSAHSWIVLKQPGVNAGGLQLCIDLENPTYATDKCTITMSPSAGYGAVNGGADGTTTSRPTATDQLTLISIWMGDWYIETTAGSVVHVQMSDDGECTRVQIATNTRIYALMLIDVVKDPLTGTPGWSEAIVGVYAYGSNTPSYGELNDSAQLKARVNGAAVSAYVTSIGDGAAASGQNLIVPNDLTGCWEMYECGIWVPDSQAPVIGRLGKFYDLRWVSTALSVGDTFPQSGTLYQWMVIGDLAIPWNQLDSTYYTAN